MEYQDKKPRRKRAQSEEIGGKLLADSIISEIDRLDAIGEQAARSAETFRQIFDGLKGYKLQVDTDALAAKEKDFTTTLEKQVEQIRAATGTVRVALWLMIVMLFLCFAVGYCYLEAHPWKAKYRQMVQQYDNLQQEMQKPKKEIR